MLYLVAMADLDTQVAEIHLQPSRDAGLQRIHNHPVGPLDHSGLHRQDDEDPGTSSSYRPSDRTAPGKIPHPTSCVTRAGLPC